MFLMIDGIDDVPTGEYAWQYFKHTAQSAPIQAQYWIDPMGYVYPVDWHGTSAPELITRHFGKDKLDSLRDEYGYWKINPVDFLENNRWLHVSFIGIFGDYTQRGYESLKTLHKRMSDSDISPYSQVRNTLKHIAVYVS